MNTLDHARALYDDGSYRECLFAAKEGAASAGNGEYRLRFLLLAASSHWELGEREDCLSAVADAGPLIDEAAETLRGRFYGQRALLYRNAGDMDNAILNYEEARYWAQQAGDRDTEARVRNNLAKVYSDQGQFSDALREVDAAIEIATELNETNLVGRFHDLKAQICFDHEEFEQSLISSIAALSRLRGHPAETEAKETHDRAFARLSENYLNESDPVKKFCVRRMIAKGLGEAIDAETIRIALSRADGNVARAAKMLNLRHPSLIEAIKKHNLQRRPQRRRAKTLIPILK